MQLEPTGEFEDEPRKFGRPKKYPWEVWTDLVPHLISQAVDYPGTKTETVRISLYTYARTHNLPVNVQVDRATDRIMFQFYPPNMPRPKLPTLSTAMSPEQLQAHPKCHVCQAPLTPLSLQYGECTKFSPEGSRLISKHTGEPF